MRMLCKRRVYVDEVARLSRARGQLTGSGCLQGTRWGGALRILSL